MECAVFTPLTFGQENFGQAVLGNRSRTRRLVQLADRMVQHPGGTLPDKLSRRADLRALYRLVNQPAVTHAALLESHRVSTRQKMEQCAGTVLIVHDATELDFTGLTSLREELGQIGKGTHRGYLCHNSLAVVAETREVWGLANQILYGRPQVPKNESREHKRTRANRESRWWQRGSAGVGAPPADRRWVHIADRGADVFEYLEAQHRGGGQYVVRAQHDRNSLVLQGETWVPQRLWAHAQALPDQGRTTIEAPARLAQRGQPARKARSATVRLAAGMVALRPPKQKRGDHGDEPLTVWVVVVTEIDPPVNVEPVEWILLTHVAAPTRADVEERIAWYRCRWMIEELHKTQKTGCGIETLQFTTVAALEPAMALLSVLAVFLLQLRGASRQADARERPATEVVPEEYVEVLSAWRYGERQDRLTVWDFFYALARLGGHQNRKSDHLPGWLVLWRGWTKLQAMTEGAAIVGATKHGET